MTEYTNAVLIYNPRAGKFGRDPAGQAERAAAILRRSGRSVRVVPTTGPATAGPIARAEIERGADLIVAAGGDGTINEVVEGMVGTSAALAILPAGTANVLATETKLGRGLERVAARLDRCRPHRVSLGHLTCDGGRVSRHFLLMAGIGLDAHIVYHLSDSLKARAGKLAYWVAAWSVLGRRLPQIQVEIGGCVRQCSFALLSRVRNYGGDFEIARSVTLFDNRFETVLFEGISSLNYVKYFAGVALGRLAGMKGVTVLEATEVRLSCPGDSRAYVQVDGEYAGRLPAEVRVVPDALTLLVSEEYHAAHGR